MVKGNFDFSHLCSCLGRLFPAEGLCILLVETHTGTEKFFHQMHRVISEGNLHNPGCILCLCLGPLSKTRKKKINAVGMLFLCENCSVVTFPSKDIQILSKTEKKVLPFFGIQIQADSLYLGFFHCCCEMAVIATSPQHTLNPVSQLGTLWIPFNHYEPQNSNLEFLKWKWWLKHSSQQKWDSNGCLSILLAMY